MPDPPGCRWCLGNLMGKMDQRGNLLPAKRRTRPERKVDVDPIP
jgi:hypothetical protein